LSFLVDDEEVVLWVASNISERHTLEQRLRLLSDTDQLSGLFNRRKLEHDLTRHYESWLRYSIQTSICMFDLDNLKKINDTKGHHAGDEIIQAVANICLGALRKTDTACRFGGDEFVVALPNTAKRLLDCFRAELGRFSEGSTVVTASIGVTTIAAEDRSYEDALKRADRALYEAKSLGKNRIVAA
jgi:two-component system cell cycle response regulator